MLKLAQKAAETVFFFAVWIAVILTTAASILFIAPLASARRAWSDGNYGVAAIYLMLESWPAWAVILTLYEASKH
jgi:hypothetical protein